MLNIKLETSSNNVPSHDDVIQDFHVNINDFNLMLETKKFDKK